MLNEDIATLLERTALAVPFEEFLKEVEQTYPGLGNVTGAQPIMEGYEDANFRLSAQGGEYVIKLFLKDRSPQNVKDYVRVVEAARGVGVPTMVIVAGNQGKLSYTAADGAPYMITEFFDGKWFKTPPTLADMVQVTEFLAALNTLDFPVVSSYDSWGIAHFLDEYTQDRPRLSTEQDALVAPVSAAMHAIDFSQSSR